MNIRQAARLYRQLQEQREWVDEHGGCEAGYVERYGNPGVLRANGKPMYGNGGTAIWQADKAELTRLEALMNT